MAFKLHGAKTSTCTRRVALIAKERNIPYELVEVDFTVGQHKQPPHLQHQPFGQVPYITVRHPLPKVPLGGVAHALLNFFILSYY
jgi:glutathione S-transferase